MRELKILVLTAHAPIFGASGGAARMYYNLKILASRHRVSLISFVEQDTEKEHVAKLAALGIDVKTVLRRAERPRNFWMPTPREHDEFASAEFRELVQKTVTAQHFDVIQAEYFQMAQHVPHNLPALRVMTEHEIVFSNYQADFRRETRLWRKCLKCYEWLMQLNYEVRVCRNFHRIACMTEEDRAVLSRFVAPGRLVTVPIGVDSSYFDPARVQAQESPWRMLFVGNYRHPPNREAVHFFIREVFPRIRHEVTDAEFWIAGSNTQLLDQRVVFQTKGVTVAGYVADIRPCYRNAALFVAPIRSGTGMRVKLLEAFSMGMAVVGTPLAAHGFQSAGANVMLKATTAADFAAETIRLLRDSQLRKSLGANARRMIQDYFDWSALGPKFLELVEGVNA